MEQEIIKPRCVRCCSSFVYVRIEKKQLVCRQCGFIEDNFPDSRGEDYFEI